MDGSRKNVTWNRAINKNVFLNYTDAETISEEYIKNNECILAEEMYIKELVAFKHSFNEREIPEWYAVLDNDMIFGDIVDIQRKKRKRKLKKITKKCTGRNRT